MFKADNFILCKIISYLDRSKMYRNLSKSFKNTFDHENKHRLFIIINSQNIEFYKKYNGILLFYVNRLEFLDFLENKNIGIIHIYSRKITKINNITNMKNLKIISLLCENLVEIEGLDNLVNLQCFVINSNKIKINFLDKLHNIKELSIKCKYIKNLENLEKLTNIKKLTLLCYRLNDIKNLTRLTNLRYLTLYFRNKLKIENFDNLINLKKFTLPSRYCPENITKDFVGIENIKNLKIYYFDCWE